MGRYCFNDSHILRKGALISFKESTTLQQFLSERLTVRISKYIDVIFRIVKVNTHEIGKKPGS